MIFKNHLLIYLFLLILYKLANHQGTNTHLVEQEERKNSKKISIKKYKYIYIYIYGRIFIFSMKNSLKVTIRNIMNKSYILYLLLTKIIAKNSFFLSKFKKNLKF